MTNAHKIEISNPIKKQDPVKKVQKTTSVAAKNEANLNKLNTRICQRYFDYLKNREEKFVLHDYMDRQLNLNQSMREILVDWLVEVQENFELNHETLYLAVKMTDHYLAVSQASRESL
ncbi:hypothetical protein AOLI_G00217900 [Acnodon oligacanthus]